MNEETIEVPRSEWEWYGLANHFICGKDCRFHLATVVGAYLVSTVGAFMPDSQVREIYNEVRRLGLEGKGDDREADFLEKNGFEKLGAWGTYETMVFSFDGKYCDDDECIYGPRCQAPRPSSWMELDAERYDSAKDAREGHYRACERAAKGEISDA